MTKDMYFIDLDEVSFKWKRICNTNFDMDEFLKYVCFPVTTNLLRVYCFKDELDSRPLFPIHVSAYESIEVRPCTVKNKTLKIATEALKHAYNRSCDRMFILSEDEDLADVIRIIKDLGIIVITLNGKIREYSDGMMNFSRVPHSLL